MRLRDFSLKTSKMFISEVDENEIKKNPTELSLNTASAGAPLLALTHPKEERASPTPLSEM